MAAAISLTLAAFLLFLFGAALGYTLTTPQESDGPIAASLIGFIIAAIWLGSELSQLV